jgi:hypothetical protein
MSTSLQPTVLATGVILIIASLTLATLRFLHRAKQTKRLYAEDCAHTYTGPWTGEEALTLDSDLCLAGTTTGVVSWALLYAS